MPLLACHPWLVDGAVDIEIVETQIAAQRADDGFMFLGCGPDSGSMYPAMQG